MGAMKEKKIAQLRQLCTAEGSGSHVYIYIHTYMAMKSFSHVDRSHLLITDLMFALMERKHRLDDSTGQLIHGLH